MTSQAEQYSTEALQARAEITDRFHLYAHCVDRRRWDLLDQVFHPDATWWVSSIGTDNHWRDAMESSRELFAVALDATHHQVGNILISLDGAAADTEALITAYHRVRADAPLGGMFGGTGSPYDLFAGGRYLTAGNFATAPGRSRGAGWPPNGGTSSPRPTASSPRSPQARGKYDDTDLSTPTIERFRAARSG